MVTLNWPGEDSQEIDPRLDSLFDVHWLKQDVASTTRHDKRTGRENMLDLLVTVQSSNIVHEVRVETSHYLSDHAFVTCHFSCHRIKLPPTTYQYRDIKQQLDLDTFQRRLKSSTLITSTFNRPNEYLDEIQQVVGALLDYFPPLRTDKRPGGKGSSRWLSPETMAAKKDRRRLERR